MARVLAVALASVLVLAGCSTQYDSTIQGGVEAVRLGADRFEITAKGNQYTELETAEEFALLKAAETTIENNRAKFRVIDAKITSQKDQFYGTTFYPTVVIVIETASASAADASGEEYKTAAEVVEQLGPKHLDD